MTIARFNGRPTGATLLVLSGLLTLGACNSGGGSSPVPRVTAPSAGAAIGGNSTIRWTGFGGEGNVVLELSTDGGTTFPTTIAASTPDDGAFDWDSTSVADGADVRIRVRGEGGSARSGVFAVDNTLPVVALTSPDGGELFGTTETITWATTDANPGTVLIEASTDGGTTFPITVAASAPDNGTFAWDTTGLTDGSNYRVRVTATDRAENAGTPEISAADFELDLTAPVISLTSPTGGESLSGATNITWTTTDANPGTVAVTVSLDSGSTFPETVVTDAPDTGSLVWQTGTVADSTTLRVRIVATDGAGNLSSASESSTDVVSENLRMVGPAHYRDTNGNGEIDAGDTILVRFEEAITVNSASVGEFALPVTGDAFGAGASMAAGAENDTLVITLGAGPTIRTRSTFDAADVDADSPSGLELADPITADAIESTATGTDAAAIGPLDITTQPVNLAPVAAGGVTPGRGALGDLDGDGDLDLVVAVNGADASQRWSGDGDQGWTQSQSLSTSDARDVAIGDVDGDGDLDAVLAVSGANEVWTNDGSGALTNSGQVLGSSASTSVALADVDRDGDLDAVFGNELTQPDRIWINGGTGLFTDSGQTLGTTSTNDVLLADFDRDGDLDIFYGADDADSGLWLNNGAGSFSAGSRIGQTAVQAVATGDFDRDGDLDIALAVLGQNQVRLGDGAGGFGSPRFLGNNDNRGVVTIDLDSDGDLDLYTAKNVDSGKYFLNDGAGVFTEDTVDSEPDVATDVVVGRLDGDSDDDLLVMNDASGYRPYRGSTAGGQDGADYAVTNLTDGPWQSGIPSAGDIDRDGDVDLIVPDVGSTSRILLSSGDGTFTAGTSFGSDAGREGDLFDADRDGDLDLLQRLGAFGAIADRLWLGNGSGGFTDSGLTLGTDTYVAGDLDGDGDDDLIVVTSTTVDTWDGNGAGGFAFTGQSLALSGVTSITFGDLDRDGDIDIAAGRSTDVRVLANDGNGAFTSAATLAALAGGTAIAAADLDRDGDLDLLHASSTGGTDLRWARNDGSFTFAAPQTAAAVQNGFTSIEIIELEDDGDLDVIAVDASTGSLYLMEGNGNGTFTPGSAIAVSDISGVRAVDADRDGDLDLYVARGNDTTPGTSTDQLRVLD